MTKIRRTSEIDTQRVSKKGRLDKSIKTQLTAVVKTKDRVIQCMTAMQQPSEQFDDLEEHPRLNRKAFAVFSSFAEADAADRAYWASRTPHERLRRHMEVLRRMNYGSKATERLQRVLEFAHRESR